MDITINDSVKFFFSLVLVPENARLLKYAVHWDGRTNTATNTACLNLVLVNIRISRVSGSVCFSNRRARTKTVH